MHLGCFVLACKKIWVLDTSCCPDHCFRSRGVCRSTHKDTHTKKETSAASRGFVVSSCWLPFPNARHNKLPSCIFFALCPFHRFFFGTLPVPSLFFTLCRSHRFFLHCVCHIVFFFALCPFHRFFFYTLPVTSIAFFFCTLSVTSHFFLQFGGCFVFFCNPLSQLHFFLQREDWRSQSCIFFARRICIIRLLQFRLHFSLHFCIYFAFFFVFFLPIFLHFELQVAKKMQRENTLVSIVFFFAPACSARPRVAFLGIRRVNPSLEAIRFPSFVLCQTQVGEFVTDDSRWKTRAKRERSSVLHINIYIYIYIIYLSIY